MSALSRKDQILQMLETDPSNSFLLFALAKEWENEESWLEAKSTYENLLLKDAAYVGLYYHYGKLLERLEEKEEALKIYRLGITKCLESNDLHSKSELQSALMNLEIEED